MTELELINDNLGEIEQSLNQIYRNIEDSSPNDEIDNVRGELENLNDHVQEATAELEGIKDVLQELVECLKHKHDENQEPEEPEPAQMTPDRYCPKCGACLQEITRMTDVHFCPKCSQKIREANQ